MNRSTWKNSERMNARFFNSERNPLSGINSRHTSSDSLHPSVYIESKHLKVLPKEKLWYKTEKFAKKENKIPLMIFRKTGHPHPLILCKLEDIKKIAEQIKEDSGDRGVVSLTAP